jgi:hypothetical protein
MSGVSLRQVGDFYHQTIAHESNPKPSLANSSGSRPMKKSTVCGPEQGR